MLTPSLVISLAALVYGDNAGQSGADSFVLFHHLLLPSTAVVATTHLMVDLLQPLRFMAAQVLTPSMELPLAAVLRVKPVMTSQLSPQSRFHRVGW